MTYVTPTGGIQIRHSESTTTQMCEAARVLKARFFVTVDGYSELKGQPILGVFDMKTAQKDTPIRGEWSINDPKKTFDLEHLDAAVMWAVIEASR